MKPKVWTVHSKWEVFRGDSQDLQNLIFTAKKHSVVNLKTKLDVFLANNTAEKVPDFRVQGSFLNNSCTIYAGTKDPIIIAEMQKEEKKQKVDNILLGEHNFVVTACPNIDYAFIVALIVILEEIHRKSEAPSHKIMDVVTATLEVAGS